MHPAVEAPRQYVTTRIEILGGIIAKIVATGTSACKRGTFAMYKMMIDVSGEDRINVFRGPGGRKTMLQWWDDYLDRAKGEEDIRSIRVWGTVGNKTDLDRQWVRGEKAQ